MSKFRDVPYSVYGHSSWEQFWSNNNPDGKKPKPSTGGGGYPKIDKRKFKKDVLEIIEKMHAKTPIMDFEETKAQFKKAIREGDQ